MFESCIHIVQRHEHRYVGLEYAQWTLPTRYVSSVNMMVYETNHHDNREVLYSNLNTVRGISNAHQVICLE